MEINDISEILNFRWHVKFSSKFKWYPHYEIIPEADREEHLNKVKQFPRVFNQFKTIIAIHGLPPWGPLKQYLKYRGLNKKATFYTHTDYSINKSNDLYCDVNRIPMIQRVLESSKDNEPYRNLICCGDDIHLSYAIKYLEPIRDKFEKIYFEAKDIICDWVQTIPMGMIMAYMLRNGGNNIILEQINKKKTKTKLIGTAFGSRWPELTEKIKDRSDLLKLVESKKFIKDMFCPPEEYYERLCDFKYFACPLGNGVQTPKICECIMCETIPIVTDHVAHRELRDIYKLPLLIIPDWNELTVDMLNNQWEQQYSKIDWEEQKSKFLVSNFENLLKY